MIKPEAIKNTLLKRVSYFLRNISTILKMNDHMHDCRAYSGDDNHAKEFLVTLIAVTPLNSGLALDVLQSLTSSLKAMNCSASDEDIAVGTCYINSVGLMWGIDYALYASDVR